MRVRFALAALVVLTACKKKDAAIQPSSQPPLDSGMSVIDSFRTPESVLYDEASDRYLVSNINGAPTAKDGNGFISIVGPSGRVTELKWIEGGKNGVTLNAPKGMGIRGDTLFVADIDEVRMFNRTNGHPVGTIPVRGATFLNDVSVGPDGAVWFTDSGLKPDFSSSGTDAIYHRAAAGGQVHQLAHGADLGRPNGIYAESTTAVVVTFGSGEVYRVDMQGHRTNLAKPPHGQLDGIIRLPGNRFAVSSWEDSSVVSIPMQPDSAAMAMALVHGVESPADIGFDTQRNRILIPSFNGNRIDVRPATAPASAHNP